jgi:hypothetical protein
MSYCKSRDMPTTIVCILRRTYFLIKFKFPSEVSGLYYQGIIISFDVQVLSPYVDVYETWFRLPKLYYIVVVSHDS